MLWFEIKFRLNENSQGEMRIAIFNFKMIDEN